MSGMQGFPGRVGLAGFLVLLAVLAVGCGAQQEKPSAMPVDDDLDRINRAARLAFENRRPEQAADLYRRALERALVRADANQVADVRYNLAVCLMELGDTRRALERVTQAKSELVRAGLPIPADFHLLEATILYRDNRPVKSSGSLDAILSSSKDPAPVILSKTYFLQGLIAAENGNVVRLKEAIANMGIASDDDLRADRAELIGRLAILEQRWRQAVSALDNAVGLRRRGLDYRRMAIALALSAEACERDGRGKEAAGRYLQAGRSAAVAGEVSDAGRWLQRAAELSEQYDDPEIAREAGDLLDRLAEE